MTRFVGVRWEFAFLIEVGVGLLATLVGWRLVKKQDERE